MPYDDFIYIVDGLSYIVPDNNAFQTVTIELGPGEHEIVFRHRRNPENDNVPTPAPADYEGVVYIDDVTFVPSFQVIVRITS